MHARSRRRPRRLRTGVHGLGRVTSRWVLLWANQRVLVSFLKCRCILWRKRVLTGVFSAVRPCVCRARAARRLQNGDAEPQVPYGTVPCGSSWDPPWRLPTGGLQRLRARGSERGQRGGSSAAPGRGTVRGAARSPALRPPVRVLAAGPRAPAFARDTLTGEARVSGAALPRPLVVRQM